MRRSGWWAVLVATAVVAGGSVAALAIGGLADGVGGVFRALPFLLVTILFWRWVLRDVKERVRPEVDGTTGAAVPPTEEVGPWGVVGRVLLGLLVVGGSFLVWADAAFREDDAPARRAAEQADVRARRLGLTYAEVVDLVDASRSSDDPTGGPGAAAVLDDRFEVPDAQVVDVVVGGAGAAVFLRPDGGEPCGVLVIDRDDLRSTRTASRC